MNWIKLNLSRHIRTGMVAFLLAITASDGQAQITSVASGIAATSSTNNFVATTVAPNGDFVAAWRIGDMLTVGKWTGSAWSTSSIASSTAVGSGWGYNDDVDIVVASNGIYHLAVRAWYSSGICCSQERGVWHATFNPSNSAWSFQKIQSYTDPNGYKSADNPTIALDANNNPELVWEYSDANNPRLKEFRHAVKNGSNWTITSHAATSGDSHGDVVSPNIAITSTGKRYISFMSNTTQTTLQDQLFCRTDVSGSWATQSVQGIDNNFNYGDPNGMVLINDLPTVAYAASGSGAGAVFMVKLATYNGSSWTNTTIDNSTGVGAKPAIATNASGTMLIAYLKKNTVSTKNDVWVAYKTPTGSWTTQLLYGDGATNMGSYLDVALDNNGRFVVLWHNQVLSAQRDVRYYIGDIANGGSTAPSNTAPAISNQNFSINENSTIGTVVGTVVATDADNDSLTYSITAGNTGGAFAINGNSGHITVANGSLLNHEFTASYALTVSVSDGTTSSTATITVNVNDVNEQPSIADQSFAINENSANGTVVGTVAATDPDGNALSYSITSGNAGGAFAISSGSGQITVANTAVLDFETNPAFYLVVRATDGTLFDTANVTVNLNDVVEAGNTAPVMQNASISVSEDGFIYIAPAIDASNPNTYFDADNDEPTLVRLTVLPSNGVLRLAGATVVLGTNYSLADFYAFEYIPNANYNGTDTFAMEAFDGQAWSSTPCEVGVTVNAVNDLPVLEDLAIATSEDQQIFVVDFATASTFTDVDGDQPVFFKVISAPAHGSLSLYGNPVGSGDDIANADLDDLVYTPNTDFNGSDSFTWNMTDGQAYATSNATAYITVSAVNDVPTDISLSNTQVDENTANGTMVGTLSATDADSADSHYFLLVSGLGDEGNPYFTISGSQLQVASGINFERIPQTSIRILAVDLSGASFERSFTITVGDVNDTPYSISLTNNTVSEQQAAGAFIGALITSDEDANDSHTLTLVSGAGDADNASFAIVNNVLVTDAVLDFNTQQQYSIRVRSTDAAGAFIEETFVINLQDVNQAPTAVALSNATIVENNLVGQFIGYFTATDPDAGDTHTYTLASGAGDADNASFTIDNGDLKAAASFDFETKDTYSIRVRTTDAAGEHTEEVFTITIIDATDAPIGITLSNNTIDENDVAGTLVGGFSTQDPDQINGFTYSLVGGVGADDNGAFFISGSALMASASFDYETKSSYSIRVRSEDNGGGYTEEVFTITVNDRNDAPTGITTNVIGIDENSPVGTAVGFFGTIDQDILDTHTYTLAPGFGANDNGKFSIVANKLQVNANLDYEQQNTYSVRVRSTDDAGAWTEQHMSIIITDVNEVPTAITLSAMSIAENNAAGATVGTFGTTDQDHADSHTYAFVAGQGDADNGAFHISGNMLIANASFNFEVKNSYSIRVASTDLGGLSTEAMFTITIIDVIDAPLVTNLSRNVLQNATAPLSPREFLLAFSQDEGNVLQSIRITSLPLHGTLTMYNVPVTVGQTILLSELSSTVYAPSLGYRGIDEFGFMVFDGVSYSLDATYTYNVLASRQVGATTGQINTGTLVMLGQTQQQFNREGEAVGMEEIALEATTLGNHPNPFQGVTSITFELPASMKVTLEVYDVLGRKVETLVDGEELTGANTVQWTGHEAGTYICRLVATGANGETVTKTINLLQVK